MKMCRRSKSCSGSKRIVAKIQQTWKWNGRHKNRTVGIYFSFSITKIWIIIWYNYKIFIILWKQITYSYNGKKSEFISLFDRNLNKRIIHELENSMDIRKFLNNNFILTNLKPFWLQFPFKIYRYSKFILLNVSV